MDNGCFGDWEENDDNTNTPPNQRMARLLCAMAPHLPPKMRTPLMMMGKVMELMAILNEPPPPSGDDSMFEPDMEAMMKSMRRFCSKKERAMFDQFSSMMSAMKMFRTYQEMSNMMGGFNPEGGGGNPFDALFSFMGNGTAESDSAQTVTEMPVTEYNNNTLYSDIPAEPYQYDNVDIETLEFKEEPHFDDYNDGQYATETAYETNSDPAPASGGNSQMFDTLSAMLTPEQQSMFQMMKGMMDSGMFPTK